MKAKTSNNNKKEGTRKKSELAKKILRTVSQNEAFYFFTDIGEYTGEYASNLDNFCNKIKIMELKCMLFHSDRQDFEKWIKETIGDSVLADEISNVQNSVKRDDLGTEIHRIVKQRLSQLKKILASEDALIEHF